MSPKSVKLGILFLILFTVVIISSKITSGPFKDLPFIGSSTFHFEFKSETLSKIVQRNLGGKKGDYAIYIEYLPDPDSIGTDGENYTLRSNDTFLAASLYKLYLMVTVLSEVKNGNLKMEDEINVNKSDLIQTFGDIDFGYEDAPEEISYTVEETMQRIARISDNFAAIALGDKVGWDKVNQMVQDLGAKDTTIKEPISTSASDMGAFFKKLYYREIVDQPSSDKLLDFLSLNQLNNRIPALLPDGTKVIHKTGELPHIRHDAGIVFLPNGKAYIIVLMSQNLEYEDDGVEALANISKDVYEYFSSKK